MKRRQFLRQTLPVALAAPFALHRLRFSALAQTPQLRSMLSQAEQNDTVLVLIQLQGGNDGLNTVIPIDDDTYHTLRPVLRIDKKDAMGLDGQPQRVLLVDPPEIGRG